MRAAMSRATILAAFAAAAITSPVSAQGSSANRVSNETRLFQHFIEDGAVTDNIWLEPQFRFDNFKDADTISFGPVLAVNIAEDIEVGGRLSLSSVDPERGDRETGFTDMDVYGKIRLSTAPTQFALGLLLKLPTGDQDKSLRLGTGEMDVAFFGGLRHDFGAISLVGNAALRINQDPDLNLPAGATGPEGETSVQIGGGLIWALTQHVSGVAELSYETERIDHAGSDFRMTLGGAYRASESVSYRAALATGTGDSAPDFELIAAAVFYF